MKNMAWHRRSRVLTRPEIQMLAKENKGFGADILDAVFDATSVGGECWCATDERYKKMGGTGKCGCGMSVGHLELWAELKK